MKEENIIVGNIYKVKEDGVYSGDGLTIREGDEIGHAFKRGQLVEVLLKKYGGWVYCRKVNGNLIQALEPRQLKKIRG